METSVFTPGPGCVTPSSHRWTESSSRISCKSWSSSKRCLVRHFHRSALMISMFGCQQSSSLLALQSSAFKIFAADSSSKTSFDAGKIEREEGMPIPGTITFRRSATQKHFEYFTDLETLGMGSFSSETSRSIAFSMGIESPMSEPTTTPASVSIDVAKEGRDLRLDGMVRTALALKCRRCGVPVAERIFGEFSLLLTEEPLVEPTKQRVGVVLGGDSPTPDEEEELEEVLDLDLDDKMHFPKTEKTIDISKYIRDTVHLEIPLQPLCSLSCKGKCIECGVNLNECSCDCALKAKNEQKRRKWSALEKLKEQLEKGR